MAGGVEPTGVLPGELRLVGELVGVAAVADRLLEGRATGEGEGLRLLLHQLGAYRLPHLFERAQPALGVALDLNQVEAEGGLHRADDLPGLGGEGRLLEGGDHLAAVELPEVAPLGSGAVLRVLLGEGREVAPLLGLGEELDRLVLHLLHLRRVRILGDAQKDVAGAHPLRDLVPVEVGLVGLVQLAVAGGDLLLEVRGAEGEGGDLHLLRDHVALRVGRVKGAEGGVVHLHLAGELGGIDAAVGDLDLLPLQAVGLCHLGVAHRQGAPHQPRQVEAGEELAPVGLELLRREALAAQIGVVVPPLELAPLLELGDRLDGVEELRIAHRQPHLRGGVGQEPPADQVVQGPLLQTELLH